MATIKTKKQLKAAIREMIVQESAPTLRFKKPRTIKEAVDLAENLADLGDMLASEIGGVAENIDRILDGSNPITREVKSEFSKCLKPLNELNMHLNGARKLIKQIGDEENG